MGAEEGAGQVQGRGQAVGGEATDAAVGRHEVEAGLGAKEVGDADGAAEMGEVGAAAHADVLAGVEDLSGGGVGEGAGPAAEAVARFEDRDLKTAFGEGRGGRESRQPRADDDDPIRHAGAVPSSEGVIETRLADHSQVIYKKVLHRRSPWASVRGGSDLKTIPDSSMVERAAVNR